MRPQAAAVRRPWRIYTPGKIVISALVFAPVHDLENNEHGLDA